MSSSWIGQTEETWMCLLYAGGLNMMVMTINGDDGDDGDETEEMYMCMLYAVSVIM